MIEFYLKPENGKRTDITLIGFTSLDTLISYVRDVGEVRLVATDKRKEEPLTMVVPNG